MKRILIILILCAFQVLASDNYKKVKLINADKNDLILLGRIGIDHLAKSSDGSFEFFVSENEYEQMLKYNLSPEILIDDWHNYYKQTHIADEAELFKQIKTTKQKFGVTGFDYGTMGGYYTLTEVYSKLDEMIQNFPNLISQKEIIGYTNEDRGIIAIKISDNPNIDEDEPEILYTALHHAREPESMMQMIYFMFYLLENYGSDTEATYLVNNREMYFIPVVNPDGYEYNRVNNQNGGGMWRKNRRNNLDGQFGVDLNRNYGPVQYWNSPNGGSSLQTSSDVYRGTAPFSEPETAAIRKFLINHKIKTCLNYHAFGNLLIYPYGALPIETPDSAIFREFARDMTRYNNYFFGTDQQTVNYSTRGNSDDFMYDGEPDSLDKIFAMTPEVGAGSDGFWPSQSRIIPLAEENVFPNLYYAWISGGYVGAKNYTLDREFVEPGDTVNLSVTFINKGLSELNDFDAVVWSESEKILFTKDRFNHAGLDSRSELNAEDIFTFIISPDAVIGSDIDLFITTTKEDLVLFTEPISINVGKPIILFADDSVSVDSNWTISTNTSHQWENTSTSFYSSPVSITDSRNGNYKPSAKISMQLKNPISLKNIARPILSFKTKFEIEKDWDYGQCLISADSGATWQSIKGQYATSAVGDFQPAGQYVYSGNVYEWVSEEINLSDFSGENILIKFELNSDEYFELDGWYLDDIRIVYYNDQLSELTNSENSPDQYKLLQNYPNPFNPYTTIVYQLPDNSDVEINIFNLNGELINSFNYLGKAQGTYSLKWEGSNTLGFKVASGIYLCKMKAVSNVDGRIITKISKMMLMK
ncbi:MAG: immune inhibitor A [Bacteroidetes bacterium]|nr:immune inhibitor A [Bacteroidota bacterium]